MAFFAEAGLAAMRYGVVFDHVVAHLWRARRHRPRPIELAAIRHVEDLVVAVACAEGSSTAWVELIEHFEPILVRRAQPRIGETRSLLLVRRMLTDLRAARCADGGISTYIGERPLRAWLTDRVLAEASTLSREKKAPHAEVRTRGGTTLQRSDAAEPAVRWWDGLDLPACLPITRPSAGLPSATPPAAGAE